MTNQHIQQAAEFAPIIERVHGEHHPELTRVRQLTEQLQQAKNAAAASDLFGQLRTVTDHYAVPADGCEAYQATYQALERADKQHTTAV